MNGMTTHTTHTHRDMKDLKFTTFPLRLIYIYKGRCLKVLSHTRYSKLKKDKSAINYSLY